MFPLLVIDRLTRPLHHNLTLDDECYYFMNYTSGKGYSFSRANQLIHNFKKEVTRQGKPEYYYKGEAIREVSQWLRTEVPKIFDLTECTLVPIPPSKPKSHTEYDDRMTKTLRKAFPENLNAIQKLIQMIDERPAYHESNDARSVDELYMNMEFDTALPRNASRNFLLFDDVITTGAHFKASKRLLLEKNSNAKVVGIFIARREFDELDELKLMFSEIED